MKKYDVIVIGAGPAGLIASGIAASNKKSVLLLDKNKMVGRKLRITGKGRCNITNVCENSDFFDNIPVNSKFLYSAYRKFNNYDVISFFENIGLKTVVERGGRVFPESQKATDVAIALKKFIDNNNVKFSQEEVVSLLWDNNTVSGVRTQFQTYFSEKVIIATGGMSYPLTGSTGDGYKFAEKCGHSIIPPYPSLVPVEISEKFCSELQGLSLRNISIRLLKEGKEVFSDFGEMLFTHFGVSGPVILSASSHISKNSNYKIIIDLKPALTEEMLDKRLLRDFSENNNKNFSNSLNALLPKTLIPVVIKLSGIDPYKKVNTITKEERFVLINLLKNFTLNVKRLRPISEAIVTSGGINVKEINPSTMESKICSGLFFCGEVIDVDAYTGGFNLQIAFSTGYLAGKSCS